MLLLHVVYTCVIVEKKEKRNINVSAINCSIFPRKRKIHISRRGNANSQAQVRSKASELSQGTRQQVD